MPTTTQERRSGARRITLDISEVQFRDLENGRVEFLGYGAVWDAPYETPQGTERVKPGAFTESLATSPDVRLLAQHDAATVMARTTAGDLTLVEDDHGLAVRGELDPEDPDVIRLRRKVANRHITGMSFAFWIMPGGLERVVVNGKPEIWLTRLDIDGGDVSAVTYPAYPATAAEFRTLATIAPAGTEARALFDDAAQELDIETMRNVVERLEARALTQTDVLLRLMRAVDDNLGGETYDFYYWIRDINESESWVVVRAIAYEPGQPLETGFYQAPYALSDDGSVALDPWIEVLPRTVYDPAPPPEGQEEAESGDTPSTMSINEARTATRMRRRH